MKKIFNIYFNELRHCINDTGVMVFFILVPLGYPILYTYIYSQEVVREIPVAACDLSNSSDSRKFVRLADATPEISIYAYCNDMLSARNLMQQDKVKGIIYIPEEFSYNLNNFKQAHISIYSSMASLFYYKSLLVSCTEVSLAMNKEILISRLNPTTEREAETETTPLQSRAIGIANQAAGFANFVIPAILILIIQQTLLLGIGMRMGTERESGIASNGNVLYSVAEVIGRSAAYLTIYIPVTTYILCIVPAIFKLSQLSNPFTLLIFMFPYMLACIFMAITLGCMVFERETAMLLFVFTSVPFLFLSGISWPGSAIPVFWKIISYVLPSTFGINGFVSINETGASLHDVLFEYHALWIQCFIYFITACIMVIIRHNNKNNNTTAKRNITETF